MRKAVKGKPLPLNGIMGQRDKLSYGDIKMIQSMYKNECPGMQSLERVLDETRNKDGALNRYS